jgi:hypothetical protein
MTDTANLQKQTVKQLAVRFGVSERQLYKAGLVYRWRPDLGDKVAAGEMSVHAAYLETTGKPKPTSRDRLLRHGTTRPTPTVLNCSDPCGKAGPSLDLICKFADEENGGA